MSMGKNTVFALSTAFARSAIAVIRVSGVSALKGLKKLTKRDNFKFSQMTLSYIYDSEDNIIDKALVVVFPEGKSYTGEILVEYHVHGSVAVIKDLLYTLSLMDNHRLAEPGEFTRIALEKGKIDILQAEGILDLINAQTTLQRKQSLRELTGEIGGKYNKWYEELKNTLAFYEATIDFSDQEIPEDTFILAKENINNLIIEMKNQVDYSDSIKKIREGIVVAIIGSANVGKSTLINYLSGKDVAIVSEIEGTTRDVIEVFLDVEGFPVLLSDTAGIRESEDIIEKEGIKRAIEKAKQADIKIIMLDATNFEKSYANVQKYVDENSFLLINKIDINPNIDSKTGEYLISLRSLEGLDKFKKAFVSKLEDITALYEHPIILQQRHKNIILGCLEELNFAQETSNDIIISALHLRLALNGIGKIMGKIDIEEILGIIFSKFCIGK